MYKWIFTITLMLCLYNTLSAQNSTEVEMAFKRKLEAVSSTNKTIHAHFTHVQKAKNIKDPIVRKGNFYYDNSGLMAMHYTQPQGDKVIMRADAFIITTSGQTKRVDAAANPMLAQLSYMMQACMSGDVSKLGRGWQMKVEQTDSDFTVVLIPTDRRILRYLVSITMCFDGNNLTLKELRMDEKTGGYTHYCFSDKYINVEIDPTLFKAE